MSQGNTDPRHRLYIELEGLDRSIYELLKKRIQVVSEISGLASEQPKQLVPKTNIREAFEAQHVERLAHLTAALLATAQTRDPAGKTNAKKILIVGDHGPIAQRFERIFSELGFGAQLVPAGTDLDTPVSDSEPPAAVIALPFVGGERESGWVESRPRTDPLTLEEEPGTNLYGEDGIEKKSVSKQSLLEQRGPLQPGDLLADGRFRVQSTLGRGGMGIIYAVYDRARDSEVALKTLLRTEPEAIYRLKREFRALADLTHPNLVRLHELFITRDQCYFTMELLRGVDFYTYVTGNDRQKRQPANHAAARVSSTLSDRAGVLSSQSPTLVLQRKSSHHASAKPDASTVFNEQRLRSVLRQLAAGIHALHSAGMLHRDLKPSNVLIDETGQLTILDFGLAFDPQEKAGGSSNDVIAGTPIYMAPELLEGGLATPASDWYAVGVMLYEVMTARVPFSGTTLQIIVDKRHIEPSPPSVSVDGIPPDLEALAVHLLKRVPSQRPNAEEILSVIGARAPVIHALPRDWARPIQLIGREFHLRRIREAFLQVKTRRKPVVVLLTGPWGTGKSALLERAIEDFDQEATVLVGRCYERESVPHKAFDEIMDNLARALSSLGTNEAANLIPEDGLALVRLFPALRRVEAFSTSRLRECNIADGRVMRRRAYRALDDLLRVLAHKNPVVIALDDLQWGDSDSARLLSELLGKEQSPPLLLIATYLTTETERAPCWDVFFSGSRPLREMVDVIELPVRELTLEQAKALAAELLRGAPAAAQSQLDSICLESCGNHLLLRELCIHVCMENAPQIRAVDEALNFGEVVRARLNRLSPTARSLFELVCVSGRPLSQNVARLALKGDFDLSAVFAQLQNERLIKPRFSKFPDAYDAYHDRIGAAGLSDIDPDRMRELHLSLANAHERAGAADPEMLARHYAEAGVRTQAAYWAEQAAAAAREAFAFDRSAQLYRTAMELSDDSSPDRFSLRVKLAGALSDAGRGTEAAPIFLDAAENALPPQALELQLRAAEQWLVSGNTAEGVAALSRVLQSAHLRLPRSPRAALIDLFLTRARLRLRLSRLRFKERDESEVPPAELVRMDACRAVWAFSFVDTMVSAAYQARFLLMALESGEPYRIALGLGMEAILMATEGNRALARITELQKAQRVITARVNHPHATAFEYFAEGNCAYLLGRWRRCTDALEHAERLLTERCRNVTWEINSSRFFWGNALVFRGRWRELSRRLDGWFRDAEERGDRFALANLGVLRTRSTTLAAGATEKAHAQIDQAQATWNYGEFGVQQFLGLISRVQIFLYEGAADKALEVVEGFWTAFKKSPMPRIQLCRIHAHHHAGYAALAVAARTGGSVQEVLLGKVRDHITALRREAIPWSAPFALQMEAADAWISHQSQVTSEKLHAAVAAFDANDLPFYAAACRYRLGGLIGGEHGRDLRSRAEALYSEQGVAYPRRFIQMMAPGFLDEEKI
jgi:eukaryotic-like serine/threonine-protein kinase